jgi:hypothetical protein
VILYNNPPVYDGGVTPAPEEGKFQISPPSMALSLSLTGGGFRGFGGGVKAEGEGRTSGRQGRPGRRAKGGNRWRTNILNKTNNQT